MHHTEGGYNFTFFILSVWISFRFLFLRTYGSFAEHFGAVDLLQCIKWCISKKPHYNCSFWYPHNRTLAFIFVFSDILIYAFRNPDARRELQLNKIHFDFKGFCWFCFLPGNSPRTSDHGIFFRIIRVDISKRIFFAIFLQYFLVYCPTGM